MRCIVTGVHKSRTSISRAANFFMLAPNISVSRYRTLLLISFLVRRILRWHVGVWTICETFSQAFEMELLLSVIVGYSLISSSRLWMATLYSASLQKKRLSAIWIPSSCPLLRDRLLQVVSRQPFTEESRVWFQTSPCRIFMNTVALKQVLRFFPFSIIPSLFRTHISFICHRRYIMLVIDSVLK